MGQHLTVTQPTMYKRQKRDTKSSGNRHTEEEKRLLK